MFILAAILMSHTMVSFAGWQREEKWSYLNSDGEEIRSEWFWEENGKVYYFNEEGYLETGWQTIDGCRYFFDESGVMVTGLAVIDGRLYDLGEKGELFIGDRMIEGISYRFTEDGIGQEEVEDASLYRKYTAEGETDLEIRTGQKGWWIRQLPVLLFLLAGLILFAGTRKRDMGTLALIMYLSVLMASLPLLLPYLIKGHDLTFHLNRILGIEESLKSGMFPVRLNGYSLNGYGYADPVFYPQLFLYIPALLHMMGVPFPTAVNLFLIMVHAATAIVMYCCAKKMFGSPEIGCISSVIYTLCIYRLCNSYMRAAYGEMTAMVFLPLILYGFYELFFGDEKKWPVLVLGVTGVIQSHIISTMLTAILCMAGGLCCLGRMREKARLYSCVKAILAAVMLNLWFLLPLLQYMGTEIDTSPLQMIAGNHTVPAAKVMEAFSRSSGETPSPYRDLSNAMPAVPGLVLICGSFLFLWQRFIKREKYDKKTIVCFLLGIGLTVCGSSLFPWGLLAGNRLFGMFASYVQYPWRFFGFAACLLSMVSAAAFYRFYEGKKKKMICFLALLLAVLSSQYLIDDYMRNPASVWSETDVTPMIGQWEYLYPGTDKQHLNQAFVSSDNIVISDTEKKGMSAAFSYRMETAREETFVDVPLLYYPGYRAVDQEGRELTVVRSEKNLIRIIPDNSGGRISVVFREKISWRIAEIISLIAIIWVTVELLKGRRWLCRRNVGPSKVFNE